MVRYCQAKPLQMRLVGAVERVARRIDREAQMVREFQPAPLSRHDSLQFHAFRLAIQLREIDFCAGHRI